MYPNTITLKGKIMNETFESRWGYHPCDYQTYLKLKAIKKWYWQTVKDAARLHRWTRKDPQNRVIRRWKRNETGQKIGYEIVGKQPEPKVCPFFEPKVYANWYNIVNGGWLSEFEKARMPQRTAELVRPLNYSVDEINKAYYQCKKWFEEKGE